MRLHGLDDAVGKLGGTNTSLIDKRDENVDPMMMSSSDALEAEHASSALITLIVGLCIYFVLVALCSLCFYLRRLSRHRKEVRSDTVIQTTANPRRSKPRSARRLHMPGSPRRHRKHPEETEVALVDHTDGGATPTISWLAGYTYTPSPRGDPTPPLEERVHSVREISSGSEGRAEA